ncbi:hypothetical protein FRC00_010976 [Tulasnella sp. 408]|nr:hypothetical protein FRC00_010976 [Tulasnella sp. 408]
MTDDAVLAARVLYSNIADPPINRLPTEIITLILQFAVLLGPRTKLQSESLQNGDGLEYYQELSLIRRVCKKWQSIIETNPAFWIYISTSLPPRLFGKIVESAPGGRNLFVEYSASTSFGEGERLLAYGPRILQLSESWTSLHVRFANPSQLLQVLEQPTPRLRKLYVEHSGTTGTFERLEKGSRTVALPLEILKVKDSIFPWTWSSISDLLEIDVDCSYVCPYFSQGFIDVLRSSPRLRSLSLRFCRTDFQPHIQPLTIPLQNLASINIEYSSAAAGLLEAITCPPSTKLVLCDRSRSLTTQNPWVVGAFNHTNFECTDKVCLTLLPDIAVGAVVGNIHLDLRPEDEPYQSAAMLLFYKHFLKPFSETNGAQVKTLELELNLSCDAAPFVNILDSYFPNITSLEVRCYSYDMVVSSSLFDTLANPLMEEEGEPAWVLPRMERLVLDWKYSHHPLPPALMDIIRSRCSQGFTETTEASVSSPSPFLLRELYLRNCDMLPKEAGELKNILGDAVKFENIRIRNGYEDSVS